MTQKMNKSTNSTVVENRTNLSRRRAILAGGAALTGAAALSAPAILKGAPIVIRMATSWPKGLGSLGDSSTRVAREITIISEGRLQVELYPAGELVPPLGVHDAAGAGDIEMYHSAEYYFQAKHRGMNFFTTVPLGLTSVEQASWIKNGGGQALWDELNAGFGVKAMATGGPGVQMVVLPAGGIVEALFENTIDATEWVGPYDDLHFGFQKLLSTYIYPGFHEPGAIASVGLNLDFWNNLSDVDKAVITAVTDAEMTSLSADYYGNNGLALVQLKNEAGVKPTRLPEDVWNELARVSFEVTSSVADDDDMGRRIVESYDAYRTLMGSAGPMSQADYLVKRGATNLFAEV